MSSEKRYGGRIEHWFKQEFPDRADELEKIYGPNLNYIIHGHLGKDHKNRGFDHQPLHTSLVVKHENNQIETLNTIYDLGEPLVEG